MLMDEGGAPLIVGLLQGMAAGEARTAAFERRLSEPYELGCHDDRVQESFSARVRER
jgi:hypothetical protein